MKVRKGSLLAAYTDVEHLPLSTASPIVAKGLALMDQSVDTKKAEAALQGHHAVVAASEWLESEGPQRAAADAAAAAKKKAAADAKQAKNRA